MLFPMKTKRAQRLAFTQNLESPLILTQPIMDVAARVWEEDRYEAAKVCYQSMRDLDDLIDNQKAAPGGITEAERSTLTASLNEWTRAIDNGVAADSPHRDLVVIIRRFRIPAWPWQAWSKSMLYDINHRGFATLPAFLQYAEGASVAPASIFLHLCGVTQANGHYLAPPFDVRDAAKAAGLFCYFVHIVRDFQVDQQHNLNYFARSLMAECGTRPAELAAIANGAAVTPGFRRLMKTYHTLAERSRRLTRQELDRVRPYLAPRYQLSLDIVYNLYLLIFERIDVQNGGFTTAELSPPPEAVEDRLNRTVASFESGIRAS
jgi:phytoene synthase